MRNIKFKVWDEELSKISKVGAMDYDGKFELMTVNTEDNKLYAYYPDKLPVMQYIEKNDIDGNEIYEGDILGLWEDEKYTLLGYVHFNNISGRYDLYESNNCLSNFAYDYPYEFWNTVKIIGNIFDREC